jgi:hypothetical protein
MSGCLLTTCVQTRRNTSRTRITQYLIRFEDKIHISRYTEQAKIEISGEMVREQIVSACAPSYHCALILSITMPKFSRLAKTTRQDIHR